MKKIKSSFSIIWKRMFAVVLVLAIHSFIYYLGIKFNSTVLGSDTFSNIDYKSFLILSAFVLGISLYILTYSERFLIYLSLSFFACLIFIGVWSYLSPTDFFEEYLFETIYYSTGVFSPFSLGIATLLVKTVTSAKEFAFVFYSLCVVQLLLYNVTLYYLFKKIHKFLTGANVPKGIRVY